MLASICSSFLPSLHICLHNQLYFIMKLLIVAAVCLYVSAAAPPTTSRPVLLTNQERFDFVDADNDGFWSRDEIKATYAGMDDDSDGKVNVAEFVKHFSGATGLPIEFSGFWFFAEDTDESGFLESYEIEEVFVGYDMNSNGKVEFNEFDAIMKFGGQMFEDLKKTGAKLAELFAAADDDKDQKLAPSELNKLFSGADANADGVVSEAEFLTMWQAQTEMSDVESKAVFDWLDANGDKLYGGDERVAAMQTLDDNSDGFVDMNEYNFFFLFLAARVSRLAQVDPVGY